MAKRFVSFLLALILLISSLPFPAMAAEEDTTEPSVTQDTAETTEPPTTEPTQPQPTETVPLTVETPETEPKVLPAADAGDMDGGSCGENLTWTFDWSTRTLTIRGAGPMAAKESFESSVFPWNGYTIDHLVVEEGVTSLADEAFSGKAHMLTAELPDTITYLGASCFYYCSSLTVLDLPANLTTIGDSCFSTCRSLSSITIPEGVTSIGDNCFYRCESLSSVTLPKSVTELGSSCFKSCISLTEIVIPKGVTRLKAMTFKDCEALSSVTLPSTLTGVGGYCFDNCNSLNTITFPQSVTSLGIECLANSRTDWVITFLGSAPSFHANAFQSVTGTAYYPASDPTWTEEVLQNYGGTITWVPYGDSPIPPEEKDDTTVTLYKGETAYDLLTGGITLCRLAETPVTITVVPGSEDVAKVVLKQGGAQLLIGDSGVFADIAPSLFRLDQPVSYALVDGEGNVIEEKTLLLTIVDSYTVTFIYAPGLTDSHTKEEAIHDQIAYIPGKDITAPEDPERQGYLFEGWYLTRDCLGTSFFEETNLGLRLTMDGDITLYGGWDEDPCSIIMGVDTWGFKNTHADFYASSSSDAYLFLTRDIDLLKSMMDFSESAWMSFTVNGWGGSCRGMSESVILIKTGKMDLAPFAPGAAYPNQVTLPKDGTVSPVESMVNFYQIRQYMDPFWAENLNRLCSTENSNLERIFRKVGNTEEPMLLSLALSGGVEGKHAVVAFDFEKTENSCSFWVYDCSLSTTKKYPVVISRDGNRYSSSCDSWEKGWEETKKNSTTEPINIELTYALTADELLLGPILTSPGVISTFGSRSSSASGDLLLYTGNGSFTLRSGEQEAVIVDGAQVSGSLTVTCYGAINNIDAPVQYAFGLPVLGEGQSYTLTPAGSGSQELGIHYDHTANGFYIHQESDTAGTVAFDFNANVETSYASPTRQKIGVTRNDMTTPWYVVSVEGSTSGFSLSPTAESVSVCSIEETQMTITAQSDFNETTLTNVTVGEDITVIAESTKGSCVVTQGDTVIASNGYGCSVVFDSQLGSQVDPLTNVPEGSLISQPADPTRPGYVFEGWYLDKAYTEKWDFAVNTVTSDTVLYAGWSIDPGYVCSVTFQIPGQEPQIVSVTVGSLIPDHLLPKGEDRVWYLQKDCTGEPWDMAADTVQQSITLYCMTDQKTVTFLWEGQTEALTVQVSSGETVAPPKNVSQEGCTLCGWYTDESLTAPWDFSDPVTEDMTLYGKWIANIRDKNNADTGICIEIAEPESYVYTGKNIQPQVIVRDDSKVLTPGTDYTISYKNNKNASDNAQAVIQGKGNYKSVKKLTVSFSIQKVRMEDLQIQLPELVTVKPRDQKQTVKATVSTGFVSIPAAQYSISYFTDPDCTQKTEGITGAGIYYVRLKAKETASNLQGVSRVFVVKAAGAEQMLSKAKLTVPSRVSALDTAPAEEAAIAALVTKVVLNKQTYTTDSAGIAQFRERFTVTGRDADGTVYNQSQLGNLLLTPGKKTVTVSAKEDNTFGLLGEISAKVTVQGAALKKSQFTVTLGEKMSAPYNGLSQKPQITSSLKEGEDYTLSYQQGSKKIPAYQVKNAGTYTLVITGAGPYTGTLSYRFTIGKVKLADAYAAGKIRIASHSDPAYTPLGAAPRLTVTYVNGSGREVSMTENRDYTLKCSGNQTVTSSASATLTGKGNFSGTLSKKNAPELMYQIRQKDLGDSDISVTVTGVTQKQGRITSVKFSVTHSGKKVPASEYFGRMENAGDRLILTVTGQNKRYTGSCTLSLNSSLVKTGDQKQVSISLPKDARYFYTGSQLRPQVIITDGQGNDISHSFTVTYGENIKAGSATVTITGKPAFGYYGSKTLRFTILPKWTMWIFR